MVALLGCVLLLAAPAAACAQDGRPANGGWVGELNYFGANAVLSGVAAGVIRRLYGGSFEEGFVRGAAGGGIGYLGKRVSIEDFGGAGFLGRQTGAIGGSIARNAALGVGVLDSLVVPLGPLRLIVAARSLGSTRARLDLEDVVVLTGALLEDRLRMDWDRSWSAGAPVFRTSSAIGMNGEAWSGAAVGGIIILTNRDPRQMERTFSHERVHIVQRDFLKTAVGLPLEHWAVDRLKIGSFPLMNRVVLGVGYLPFHYLISGPWSRPNDLFEIEAEFLERK